MSELIRRYPSITLNYEVIPSEVCGGVYVNDIERFVPVEVKSKGFRRVGKDRFTLWEYSTSKGEVRACLLRTYPGQRSATWRIKPEAGEAGYYEQQETVSGIGYLAIDSWTGDTEDDYITRTALLDLTEHRTATIMPQDSFSIMNPTHTGGPTDVLATFPGAAFQPSFEERV